VRRRTVAAIAAERQLTSMISRGRRRRRRRRSRAAAEEEGDHDGPPPSRERRRLGLRGRRSSPPPSLVAVVLLAAAIAAAAFLSTTAPPLVAAAAAAEEEENVGGGGETGKQPHRRGSLNGFPARYCCDDGDNNNNNNNETPTWSPPYSNVHCIGENFQSSPPPPSNNNNGAPGSSPSSSNYEACEFRNLCLRAVATATPDGGTVVAAQTMNDDDDKNEFVYYQSPEEHRLQEALRLLEATSSPSPPQHQFVTISSLLRTTAAGDSNEIRAIVSPTRSGAADDGDGGGGRSPARYRLDESVVLVIVPAPYGDPRETKKANDGGASPSARPSQSLPLPPFYYWFSVHNLLSQFGLERKNALLILTTPTRRGGRDRKAATSGGSSFELCEEEDDPAGSDGAVVGRRSKERNRQRCASFHTAFFRAMGVSGSHQISSLRSIDFRTFGAAASTSNNTAASLVCSKYGVWSSALIRQQQGRDAADEEEITYDAGQGALLWAFRTHMLRHLSAAARNTGNDGESIQQYPQRVSTAQPIKVTFVSVSESIFSRQIDRIRDEFSKKEVEVEVFDSLVPNAAGGGGLDLSRVAQYSTTSHVLVSSLANDDTRSITLAAATFLPRGAVLVLYTDDDADSVGVNNQDVELLNSAGYFRTYWLRRDSKNSVESLDKLVRISRSALERSESM